MEPHFATQSEASHIWKNGDTVQYLPNYVNPCRECNCDAKLANGPQALYVKNYYCRATKYAESNKDSDNLLK
jgi:hypothetical protein